MVVFVDLDRDALPEHHGSALSLEKPFPPKLRVPPIATAESAEFPPPPTSSDNDRDTEGPAISQGKGRVTENPNRCAFSAALSCYPYVGPGPSRLPRMLTRFALSASSRKSLAPLT